MYIGFFFALAILLGIFHGGSTAHISTHHSRSKNLFQFLLEGND